MADPYKIPESQVDRDSKLRYKPGVGWKIFFWFISFLMLMAFFLLGMGEILEIGWHDYLDLAISVLLLIGLYGMAFSKKIFTESFWSNLLRVYLFWFIVYALVLPFGFGFQSYGEPVKFDGYFILEFVFFAVTLRYLYLYTNKMNYVWSEEKEII